MWTRIPYSARIGLPVRQYVREAARKPILPLRKNTDGKKLKKTTRSTTEFLISVDLGKVWPPLLQRVLRQDLARATQLQADGKPWESYDVLR